MSGGRGTFLRLVGTKVPLGLAVTLPSSARGVPEPVGGAGGSVSPPGGAPARSGLWRAPLAPARQAHTVHSAGTGSLFSSAPEDRGPDHALSLICLLQGPHSAQQMPLWLRLMSCRSSNQESHRTRHLLRSPWAPGLLAPAEAEVLLTSQILLLPPSSSPWHLHDWCGMEMGKGRFSLPGTHDL